MKTIMAIYDIVLNMLFIYYKYCVSQLIGHRELRINNFITFSRNRFYFCEVGRFDILVIILNATQHFEHVILPIVII